MSASTEETKPSGVLCDTPGCGNLSKLRCPTCIKANVKEGSNFCSQVDTSFSINTFLTQSKIQCLFQTGMFHKILGRAQINSC